MSPESIAPERKREGKLIRLPVRGSDRSRRHELEFLPAALEIIETPASAAGRIMMGVIVILVSVAIGWACIGQIDIVATANGRIIPSGQVKVIQPLEIGVVKSLRVADGDHVAAGDVLIEIDPTTDAADRDRIARDLMQEKVRQVGQVGQPSNIAGRFYRRGRAVCPTCPGSAKLVGNGWIDLAVRSKLMPAPKGTRRDRVVFVPTLSL